MVKADSVKSEALLKNSPSYSTHLPFSSVGYPLDNTLTGDKLHCNKVLSLSFKRRAYAYAVCYFVKSRFIVHRLCVSVCPSYLECTNCASGFRLHHNSHTALAGDGSAFYYCFSAQNNRCYSK